MQQKRDNWKFHHEKERVVQVKVRELEIKLSGPEEKLAQRNERIRDLGAELEALTGTSGSNEDRFGAFERAAVEIDGLRAHIDTLQEEKAEIQSKVNNFDDEALKLVMDIADTAVELHQLRAHINAIRCAHE